MPAGNLAVDPSSYYDAALLTGTIYAKDSAARSVLFTFRRTATRTNANVRVLREYHRPDGSRAALERSAYENGNLLSYELDERQSGAKGRAVVKPDPIRPNTKRIYFEYTEGGNGNAKKKTASEEWQPNTLINDMIAPFLLQHWGELMKGRAVKFRFIVLSRVETVGFKFIKDSETVRDGRPVVRVRMEPTSFVIALLVDPLFFDVEKNGAHRILDYTGRITPRLKENGQWKTVDALTVFDWKK
jgi:hypothetical protein